MQSYATHGAPARLSPRADWLRNTVLASVSADTLELVGRHALRVRLAYGQVLHEAGQPIDHVFLVLSGLVCLVPKLEPEPSPQLAMIGRDGAAGLLEYSLGAESAFACAVVKVGGTALGLSYEQLRGLQRSCPDLEAECLRCTQALTRQMVDVSAANALDKLVHRCVRWLVMAHERLDGDDVLVTHDMLATMLGVRRSGVTVATSTLQDAGLIQTARGRIRILDADGLRQAAGPGRWPRGRDGVNPTWSDGADLGGAAPGFSAIQRDGGEQPE